MSEDRRRGRPRDPAVDRVVLRDTLALLDSAGYERLRVADVAARAGVGLGALYRRWPTKYALVVDALRAAAPPREAARTDDPAEDLVTALAEFSAGLARHGALLAVLLTDPDSEVAAAVREAKIRPVHETARAHLRRALGPVPDLRSRAATGPALILQHLLLHGTPPGEPQIREHILPLMTAPGP
ncbi:TetR/AcrR family transcriptional regulator [Actinomadura viridis]|uniref:AcrR family transcriptional regulator n=1 Tax=Actinomadura viridis TaxID=58110 RepID=A0A931DKH9_9ACTN|nr:TetR/AcrR family transcriptional regulator [Actinomadura viridis]MBG6088710.1 AcrR family transcriptional regulator [Actinomadura viridis]